MQRYTEPTIFGLILVLNISETPHLSESIVCIFTKNKK